MNETIDTLAPYCRELSVGPDLPGGGGEHRDEGAVSAMSM
jgi:hypothetical protein